MMKEMRTEDYINCYLDKLNNELNVCLKPRIKEDKYFRFPVCCNCVNNTIYVWKELFEALTDEQKQKHACYVFAMLYTAEFCGKKIVIDGHKACELPFNPNIIVKELFERVGLRFSPFEELQKDIYQTKQSLYPYPDSKGSFFREGDVLCRRGILRLAVRKVFSEDGVVMIQAQSINTSNTKTITYPEVEMLSMYRIDEPVKFKNN